MPSALDRLPPGSRIAIIRLRSLGDCVLTTPAIAILKSARPDIDLAVVVEDVWAPVFEGNPDVAITLPPSAMAIRMFGPDLCLNLHGGTRSLTLTLRAGAPQRAGFAHFRGSWLYNIRIPTAQKILGVERKVHTAEHLASAIFHLGAPRVAIPRARLYSAPPAAAPPYAVFHAVASEPGKTWTAEGFLEVARWVQWALGLEPVFIGGERDDLSAFAAFERFAGRPLEDLKQLLSGAALFVGNDSGPAHMAAACGTPAVVIFGNSDAEIWSPWQARAETLIAGAGIGQLPAKDVIRAVERLKVAA